MRPTLLVLIALILAACNPNSGPASRSGNEAPRADAASTAAISESDFLSSMAVEGVKTVSYNDENGKPISFDQFIAATMSGQSFQKTFDTQGSMAMFSISPKGSDRARSATSSKYRLKVPLAASAPAIDARDLDGMLHSLSDGTKYTLLSFFFADCVPCIQEVPEINGLPLKRQNLKVLAITFDPKATATDFVEKRGLKVPVIADAQTYIDTLGISLYPTLVLISPEGRVVAAKQSAGEPAGTEPIDGWLQSVGL